MMDQLKDSETLASSSKLNAKAPEFVPRSTAPTPPPPVMQHIYAAPSFLLPYYGYENQLSVQNYYQQNAVPFYGYINPVGSAELGADRSVAAATEKNGLFDSHQKILNQEVVGVLENQSGSGGLHENTMLLIIGDHGQTINGDHGGGTAEEVETAIFALSLKKPPSFLPAAVDSLSCEFDMFGRKICINSIQQLDFAVTVSALPGLPFPFGSIGRVDSELFSLAGGESDLAQSTNRRDPRSSEVYTWMQNYVNVLCINSWQVKKYIDAYSSLSLIGFSDKDLLHVFKLYAKVQELWPLISKNFSLDKSQRSSSSLPSIKEQIDAYSIFLSSVAALARSSWTEFNLKMMGIGFCAMLSSFFLHVFAINRIGIELEQLKQTVSSLFLKVDASKTLNIDNDFQLWMHVSEVMPTVAFIVLAFLLYKSIGYPSHWTLKYVIRGTLLNYILIAIYWASESNLLNLQMVLGVVNGNLIPQATYAAGFLQLSLVAIGQLFDSKRPSNWEESTVVKGLALLSAWSSTIIVLSGKQGPLVALALLIGGWCLVRLMALEQKAEKGCSGASLSYALPVTQWSLLVVCMFFSTGHWCF